MKSILRKPQEGTCEFTNKRPVDTSESWGWSWKLQGMLGLKLIHVSKMGIRLSIYLVVVMDTKWCISAGRTLTDEDSSDYFDYHNIEPEVVPTRPPSTDYGHLILPSLETIRDGAKIQPAWIGK